MRKYLNQILLCLLGCLLVPFASFSREPELPRAAEKFEIGGHTAVLYAAPEPAAGSPWVWYAPSLKGGLSLRQRTLYYESFLKAGIAIAGYDLGEVRGSPASTAKFHRFYEEMVKRGYSARPILLGQSRGGMMMLAWSTAHPEKVGAFVGIYPVCNLASWPLTRSREATLADFGLSEEDLRARLKQFNPVENLRGLAEQRVPMFIVHGDSDKMVPLDENSALLRDRYRKLGGPITVKVIEGEGHRVCPAFFECRELVDFVLAQSPEAGAHRLIRNEAYDIRPHQDGSLHVVDLESEDSDVFRPEFTIIYSEEKPTATKVKWERPVYNLPAWKRGGDAILDVFEIGETIRLENPEVEISDHRILWDFDHERVRLQATVTLPEGQTEPLIEYKATVKQAGWYTFAYSGAPASGMDEVTRLWQPLVWDGRRLPEQSFLIPDEQCSIPGCLVESGARTVGVMADPWQFPYEMPNGRNRRFGVTVRNHDGKAQPLVFAPFLGADTQFSPGDEHEFRVQLVSRPAKLSQTFEHVARNICGFQDQRENTLCNLNNTLENMADYALSEWAHFDHANKSSYYPDAKGTVKNVSCLHPLGIAMVTDEPRFFHEQSVPIMEYLLSREKFLFAISEEGIGHSQSPTMNLDGPAMPVSELAALHRISGGQAGVFRNEAGRLYGQDRMLNMTWTTPGATWQRSLWLYRISGDRKWLKDAIGKADQYIAQRIDKQPTDFTEAGDGTFFEYMIPWWKDLYELYQDTRDPKHLAAAHEGARRYAQFVWFYPSVPDGTITVNPRGLASRRGRPDDDGLYEVAKETVPNWQVSDQGLICEGNGTVQRLGILIATHAPFFLRIAADTGDTFLRDIARSAVIGRYANFPGYHLNTRFSTAQEKADFPLHPYEHLKPTTSIHFNHILPHTNLIIDYLYSRCYDLSEGRIEFPAEYAEGYAYLQGRIYGSESGSFYHHESVRPWMPPRVVEVGDTDVNFISARSENGDGFYLALMNSCDRALEEVSVRLNPDQFEEFPTRMEATVWVDNEAQVKPIPVRDGQFTVSLSPKGITAVHLPSVQPRLEFQHEFGEAPEFTLENRGMGEIAGGKVEASVLSFGPELRWFYAWLRSDQGDPNIAGLKLNITFDSGETIELTDEDFPHEFHVDLPESVKHAEFALTPLQK